MSLVAGAVLSGAYFGDKMSPLSDTTNLAPAMAGTDLYTHIKHMSYTTSVAMGVPTILYAPFAFFNWLSPLVTLMFGWFGWAIAPLDDDEQSPAAQQGAVSADKAS